MDQFYGKKYKSVSSDNLDEYFKFIDIGYLTRKAAIAASPVSCLEKNADGSYKFTITSPIKSQVMVFKEGEEFVETRLDGAETKCVIKIEGNKLIQESVESNGRKSHIVREFTPEFMVVTTTCDGWDGKCTRTYKLVE